jgi:hypothetical protein
MKPVYLQGIHILEVSFENIAVPDQDDFGHS